MIGNNILYLNKETLSKAVEDYLNARLITAYEITVSEVVLMDCGPHAGMFRVRVKKEVKST